MFSSEHRHQPPESTVGATHIYPSAHTRSQRPAGPPRAERAPPQSAPNRMVAGQKTRNKHERQKAEIFVEIVRLFIDFTPTFALIRYP
jgi:hypothetical protein